ncbi:hypothetical protein [Actinomadura sp. 7K507]|uniref:hypothetical protein n=1 Tax=Actinomadura sp. 7K507 TaxID=2530365 RepID=UPI00104AEB91|nr:hypothetical protein [Actinomadura sp. 7K507]TDC89372.1 hypothetical protein E1285_16710 [Actinomadura sp. 7K507]
MKIIRISPSLRGASAAVAVPAAVALAVTAGPAPAASADTAWTVQPAPFTIGTSRLLGVSATGPDSVWAGGYQWHSSITLVCAGSGPCIVRQHQNPTLQRWTGGGWSWTSTPGLAGDGQIRFVDATSATGAWAAGSRDVPAGTVEGMPYLARATAGTWSEVAAPSTLRAVEALDADEAGAWVSGLPAAAGDPSVYRHESGAWIPHTLGATIQGIEQRTPDDVWAVGRTNDGGHAYAARYDGTTWHTMTPPQVEGKRGRLVSVLPLAADDVWITGYADGDGGRKHASYHWNGSTWREDVLPQCAAFGDGMHYGQGPNSANASYSASGLVDDGAGGLWAVPSMPGLQGTPRVLRYTSGSWRVEEPVPDVKGAIQGLTRIPGTSTVRAVGFRDYSKPLVLSTD